jgi:hypothetical protein
LKTTLYEQDELKYRENFSLKPYQVNRALDPMPPEPPLQCDQRKQCLHRHALQEKETGVEIEPPKTLRLINLRTGRVTFPKARNVLFSL